jgi:hypothetical protein
MFWLLIYWLLRRRLVGMLARGADGQRDLELVVLRYQIKVLSRQESRRLQFRTSDRAVLAAAALFTPSRATVLLAGRPGHAAARFGRRRRTLALEVNDPKPAMLVSVNFQNVPLPEVPAVLERLSSSG